MMPSIGPKLSIRGVSKTFIGTNGTHRALEDISIDVPEGEFLILVGPSGCGKSTLLNVVAGLEQCTAGEVLVDGKRVTGPGPDRIVIFQEGALFPWLNVQKNVEFSLKQIGVPGKQRAERADYYLRMVKLHKFAHSFIHELSGGMRQRVAIARALAVEPKVLLMDEPFSALDALTREDLYEELQEIWVRLRTTVMFITHNVREAVTLGDRVVLLGGQPGRIEGEFAIRILRPRHVDDLDVARTAQQISFAMKRGYAHLNGEEYDDEDQRAEAGVLHGLDTAVVGRS